MCFILPHSARLQYKKRRDSTEDEQEIVATFSRKRKAEDVSTVLKYSWTLKYITLIKFN